MNENHLIGISRLEEAFRQHDRLYLKKYPPERLPHKKIKLPKKRLLTVWIAAAILFGCIFAVSASKMPIEKWMTHIYEEFIEIFFEEKDFATAPSEEIPDEISLPGYQLIEKHIGEYESKQIWKNENGEMIVWTELPRNAKTTLDNENASHHTLFLGETEIFCTEKNGRKTYCWLTEEHFFSLTVPQALSEEECLHLIQITIRQN